MGSKRMFYHPLSFVTAKYFSHLHPFAGLFCKYLKETDKYKYSQGINLSMLQPIPSFIQQFINTCSKSSNPSLH